MYYYAEQNLKAYWVANLKAKIPMKLKDYSGAIKSADESIVLAKEVKNADIVKQNEKLI